MRQQWSCPDLGAGQARFTPLPVPGCNDEFPECPAAYLRTGPMVNEIRDRRRVEPFADHLIDGSVHPATLVSERAVEIENGATTTDRLSPKMLTLVHMYLRAQRERDSYALELRREKRG